ncbi:AAA family ATPase [Streptomyces sp. WMMC897]|uniref:AAA family ATPase n=1 Tax=Streptomyces sp. WMMC897 TaxID=3014782 RepID=UPI0022B60E1C|nr:SMC family ATPase [Streptomyces sp. WMMC897]MCZ7413009.1 SMC family ATPase [Streptomyces sp. WMMC897]
MRLHRLTLTAFGPFAGTHVVDFDALSGAGLFLLHGATGAGKTSVLDAVCYALYGGVPGARQSQGHTGLRSSHAPEAVPTEVSLDFTVGERRLRLARRPEHRRPKQRGHGHTTDKARSLLHEYDPATGEWRPLSRSHQEIGREVGELIGMSREQFCQVVLLPQGDFAHFLRARSDERAALLGRLFDTGRFRAVEAHLAERRTAAQQRLREADEALLALAHRMQQAVEESGTDAALPELSPGDAGLSDTVLAFAALARTTARERVTSTVLAVRAAEEHHTAALERLAAAEELARLQHRHRQASQRAGDLAARAPERTALRRRLERARAADTVVPALTARRSAEAEHREAADAEAQARATLPGHLAQAPVERLTEAERQTSQELGALDAARRAEARAEALGRELTALEHDAADDEAVLREADEWLSGWPAEQAAHRGRVDAAQAAATRAEQLAGRLDPARRRLAAAQDRDRLVVRLADASEAARRAADRSAAAREAWLDLRERRLAGIAAELASGLRPGAPCAVCGSERHPAPARPIEGQADAAAEDAALTAYQEADTRREAAERAREAVREAREAARAEAGRDTVADCARLVSGLESELAAARREAAGAHAHRERLAQAEREHERRLVERHEAGRRTAARTSRREALQSELAVQWAELTQARGEDADVAVRAGRLRRLAGELAAAAEAARRAEAAARHLKQADAAEADAVWRAAFDTPRDAADAVLDPARARELQCRLDDWQTEEAALAAELADAGISAAAERPPADVEAARWQAGKAAELRRAADAAAAAAHSRLAALDRLSAQAAEAVRAVGPRRAEHDRVTRLAHLAAGTSAENERKMRLETYVLAARLEQVAAAASTRLQRMSGGRYTLLHSDDRAGRGARSGLGLHVIDAWTGRERDTASLSGGETFFASLALALGLADVVSDEAGGTRLDTLFIDEGFGSLDEQTLDEVLEVLDSLRERDRCVGIVSHVADLRLRVPAQLEVVKRRTGSAVRHHVEDVGGPG